MSIPEYEKLMLPALRFAGDGQEHSAKQLVVHLSEQLQLTEEERHERLSSGQQTVIANRAGWATSYLKKANLLVATRRGVFKITDDGERLLSQKPPLLTNKILKDMSSEFREWVSAKSSRKKEAAATVSNDAVETSQTPEETLEASYQTLYDELATELLQRVQSSSPGFFERLVVEVLVSMGYGGSRKDAGQAVGRSGDEGIDGIIKEDRLGLDTIYIQAKRWEQAISRPEIQKFVGALQGFRAKKGVFITTSRFTNEAAQYAVGVDTAIVLIDGQTLAKYMIDFGVGVSTTNMYEVKKLDSDYFEDEDE